MSAITNPARASQLIDFDGCRWGPKKNMMPTDIDGAIEFKDRLYVFTEVKVKGTRPSRGQEWLYERLVNNLGIAGKNAVCLYVSHNTRRERQVDAAATRVERVYFHLQNDGAERANGHWFRMAGTTTTKEMIDVLLSLSGLGGLV